MRAWAKLLVLAVAALVVTQLLLQGRQPRLALGERAPPLALPDLDGRTVDLSSLRGRVVAVNFWATWCAPCLAEIPDLARVWREHRPRCFEVLGVAEESGGAAEIGPQARRLGIPYPVLLDPGGAAAAAYRVPGYPRTYLVDAEGRLRRVFEGPVRGPALEEAVRRLLPGSCPEA